MLLVLGILVLLMTVPTVVYGPRLLGRQARLAHKRCLENIDRLEREMGIGVVMSEYVEPGWQRTHYWDKTSDGGLVPGERVNLLPTHYAMTAAVASSAWSPYPMNHVQVVQADPEFDRKLKKIVLPDGVTLH